MADDPRAVLERWASRTDQEVTLPTGMRAKVRLPSPEALARNERMPKELRSVALQFAVNVVRVNELDEDGKLAYVQFREQLVSETVQALWDDEAGDWVPVHVSREQLRELSLPEEDLSALEDIAERRRTPGQVTALALERQGQLTANQAAQLLQKEAGATVDGWRGFPGQQGGPGAGGDSAHVRKPAKRAAGSDGPSAGAGH
jgi:hypothetical protein